MRRGTLKRGSVIVEFTLMAPLLAAIFMGVFQFGYAFVLYDQLEQAVRSGARYASVRPFKKTGAATFTADVKKMVAFGSTTGTTAVVAGLTEANVSVVPKLDAKGKPFAIEVFVIDYDAGFFFPINIAGKPRAEFPYVGPFINE